MMAGDIHKLIVPPAKQGVMTDLILCWRWHHIPTLGSVRHFKYSANINDVTCPNCQNLWKDGVYS